MYASLVLWNSQKNLRKMKIFLTNSCLIFKSGNPYLKVHNTDYVSELNQTSIFFQSFKDIFACVLLLLLLLLLLKYIYYSRNLRFGKQIHPHLFSLLLDIKFSNSSFADCNSTHVDLWCNFHILILEVHLNSWHVLKAIHHGRVNQLCLPQISQENDSLPFRKAIWSNWVM